MYQKHTGSNPDRLTMKRMASRAQFHTEEADGLLTQIEAETGDESLRQCTHFTTGVINRIERQMKLGLTIVTDTNLVLSGLDQKACAGLNVTTACFIDSPRVVNSAVQKRTTRAEIAVEQALSVTGPKLIVVGSAPAALARLLQIHALTPLHDVCIIAAPTGFANVVELKERLWESGLSCIVVRGRKGGVAPAVAIANALLREAAQRQKDAEG